MSRPPNRANIINRAHRIAVPLTAFLVLMAATGIGQTSRTKKDKGPRALAVMQWTADGPRLLPVTILIDGQYYDAGIYMARPVPMAVDPETVYEVQKAGESAGTFTITEAVQRGNQIWLGNGKWKSQAELNEKPKPAPTNIVVPTKETDEPPVLRRGGKNPKESKAEPPPVPSTPAPSDNDSDRPTLKKPAAPVADTKPAPASADDTDRPVLQRGARGRGEQAEKLTGDKDLQRKQPVPLPADLSPLMVAVSDAAKSQPRIFSWTWKDDAEKIRLTRAMEQLALAEISLYAKRIPNLIPGKKLEDVQVMAYDLNENNEPDLILSARIPMIVPATTPAAVKGSIRKATRVKEEPSSDNVSAPPAVIPDIYITLVAREDLNGELRKQLSSVTDSTRFDVTPRLRLVDAVDADNNGRAELLFERLADRDHSFVLYRVNSDNVTELFQGGTTPRSLIAAQ